MNASRYMSYLDLMCCGFGGAVLMFLIVASSRPEQNPTDQLLVVRCRAKTSDGGAVTKRAEVGLEFRAVGELKWQRLGSDDQHPDRWTFTAPSRNGSGSETISIWRHPVAGKWEFRPYLIDFPATTPASSATSIAPADTTAGPPPGPPEVAVTLESLGRNLRQWGNPHGVLRLPGEVGGAVTIELRTD